ncbi:MAG: GGDEF domain-containing protein [Terracidiphilus sp.]
MRRALSIFVLMIACASVGWSAQSAPLTNLSAIHQITNAQASQGLPVLFQATVTYNRGYEKTLFVQDGDAAIFVSYPAELKLVPGDRVLVQGKTKPSFNPIVVADRITLLGYGALPKAIPTSFDQMIRAEADCKLVTLRGIIRTADLTLSDVAPIHFMRLQLLMDGGYFEANVDSADEGALEDLLDAEVELTGVASESFDAKMHPTGILLHVQSLSDVKIIKRAGSTPWLLPATPMEKVISVFHQNDSTSRIRVHGTITYYLPGSAVVLQDGNKSIWIETLTRKPLQIGDAADATGFPDNHDGFLNLEHGEVRDSHIFAPVTPVKETWETMSPRGYDTPGHHDDLVSIEGRVVTEVREPSQDELVLEADGKLFSAIYRHPDGPVQAARNIPPGSKVRVTGICVLESSNAFVAHVPFKIFMRNKDDIVILARPSLINTRNLLLALGALLIVVFVVLARGWALEHKVRHQTAAWAARTEAEADVERQRSSILEDINGTRDMAEIHKEIVTMVSCSLNGAPCWLELTNGAKLGRLPKEPHELQVICEEICGRSGSPLGKIFAAIAPQTVTAGRQTLALRNGARLASLAIETRRLYSDLRRRSEFDLLTDIPNRFAMEKFLDLRMHEASSSAGIFGLVYIDLDKFKPINDRYGHHAGDLLLQAVAMRMSKQLQGSDMLARLGGDEFAALVTLQNGRFDLDHIVSRLEHCFSEPFSIDGNLIQGAASIGYAIYPEDGTTRDELLKAADTAMYQAKNGKSQMAY